ncbi:hypothetical protein [Bacillus sp. MRMR6]|uniref:hypothetical protein n=1 Tax=Bacillus sp. MRMR6 TaxID=1928617 RepID=UPI000952805F|nr:hypothetical protein [Bacillus sp. MRMR6]OLS33579.1 hypothetical protein BTR25_25115 [Bacillus sp. MRMR6]
MYIAGHTMGTPELCLKGAIDLFVSMGLDGIEIVIQEEYKCGLSPFARKNELKSIRRLLGELREEKG